MRDYSLYVLTDEHLSRRKSHVELARLAAEGGADVIQLRDKHLESRQLYETALEISKICRQHDVLFIVNDRVDIALAAKADGVHVGQGDIPAAVLRKFVPPDFIIGVSAGTAEEALRAEKDGADYVALSPVFDTSSKDDAGRGRGIEELKKMKQAVSIPVLAIGGINQDNIKEVIAAGADGAAVISAVVSQEDVTAAAASLKILITEARGI
ncbi:thiamine phosphate synthase [Candidatus Methanomassiliicoccus intestinalis]|uniref:Thiamine-phosphate synthase n=1 Tax=Candidatus Methanomassiliicoccus intestinalis TaxID=1406512 RepID=A0A8J8PBM5_9ARCH|nr:MAG: thiamine phosphate synthase [Candidatus Methanomassiliicoccus intestinalis]